MRYSLRSLKSPYLIFSKNNSWSFHNNFYDTRTFPWYSVRVSVPSFFDLKIAYTGHEWTWAWHEILSQSFGLSTVSRDDSFRRFALNDLTVRPWQSFIVSSQASRNVSSKHPRCHLLFLKKRDTYRLLSTVWTIRRCSCYGHVNMLKQRVDSYVDVVDKAKIRDNMQLLRA